MFSFGVSVVCIVRVFVLVPDGLYTYEGSDAPEVSNGRSSGNVFTSNTVEDCDIGVKVKEADENSFIGESVKSFAA